MTEDEKPDMYKKDANYVEIWVSLDEYAEEAQRSGDEAETQAKNPKLTTLVDITADSRSRGGSSPRSTYSKLLCQLQVRCRRGE